MSSFVQCLCDQDGVEEPGISLVFRSIGLSLRKAGVRVPSSGQQGPLEFKGILS